MKSNKQIPKIRKSEIFDLDLDRNIKELNNIDKEV